MKRLIAGPNAVEEALRSKAKAVFVVYVSENLNASSLKRIEELSNKARVACEIATRKHLDALAKGLHHQGIVALAGDYPYRDLDTLLRHPSQDQLLVVLDQIQDPQNLGAIIRSTHALGGTGLILTKDRSATVTPAAVRASVGATELVEIARVTNMASCLDRLDKEGFNIYGAAGESKTGITELSWKKPVAVVFGNEAKGLRRLTREHCHSLFSIPLRTQFDSLNVSAAAAITLFHISSSISQ